MDPAERLVDYLVPATLLVVGRCALAFLAWVASLPGQIARRRNHPNARMIACLGWVSLIAWPLWAVAMVWSRRRYVLKVNLSIRVPVSRPHC